MHVPDIFSSMNASNSCPTLRAPRSLVAFHKFLRLFCAYGEPRYARCIFQTKNRAWYIQICMGHSSGGGMSFSTKVKITFSSLTPTAWVLHSQPALVSSCISCSLPFVHIACCMVTFLYKTSSDLNVMWLTFMSQGQPKDAILCFRHLCSFHAE
jgi:hypothetical protein